MTSQDWKSVRETVDNIVEHLDNGHGSTIVASVNAVAQVGIMGDAVAHGVWGDRQTLIVKRYGDGEYVEFPVCAIHWIDQLDGPCQSQREMIEIMGPGQFVSPGEWDDRPRREA
jgi:hypothetical protein